MEDTDDSDQDTADEDTVSNHFWVLRWSVDSELLSPFIYISTTVSACRSYGWKCIAWPDQTDQPTVPRLGAVVWLHWADSSLRRPRAFMQLNYHKNSVSLCAREHMKRQVMVQKM